MTRFAAIQTVSTPDVERNLAAADRLIAAAAAAGARWIGLPEYFCLMGQRDDAKLAIAEADGDGPIQRFLADAARRHGVTLVGGTLPIHAKTPGRVRNACCVYGPAGERLARYDKIHLFAFDNGKESYDEARVLEAGDTPVAFEHDGWRAGLSVCYDLRFPELYRGLMRPPCDVLFVPAAFTHTTGLAHWLLLLRARAVEDQCYVVAPAQGGLHENGRRTFGHSVVIDPWGEILSLANDGAEGEGFAIADLERERIQAVRTQLPALRHRRL
ncbi:MAG: carbon-nitrogen hydrolase family protein [Burkholderiaceae bacterium]